MGPQVKFFDCSNIQARDVFFACCAQPCLQGLLVHLRDQGQLDSHEDDLLSACYCESCYPCVITDGCVCLAVVEQGTGLALNNDAAGDVARAAYIAKTRMQLLEKAGAEVRESTVCIQQACSPCYCLPCHNAALARELRPLGHGSFWCADTDQDSQSIAAMQLL
jgi:hypothetical protein